MLSVEAGSKELWWMISTERSFERSFKGPLDFLFEPKQLRGTFKMQFQRARFGMQGTHYFSWSSRPASNLPHGFWVRLWLRVRRGDENLSWSSSLWPEKWNHVTRVLAHVLSVRVVLKISRPWIIEKYWGGRKTSLPNRKEAMKPEICCEFFPKNDNYSSSFNGSCSYPLTPRAISRCTPIIKYDAARSSFVTESMLAFQRHNTPSYPKERDQKAKEFRERSRTMGKLWTCTNYWGI